MQGLGLLTSLALTKQACCMRMHLQTRTPEHTLMCSLAPRHTLQKYHTEYDTPKQGKSLMSHELGSHAFHRAQRGPPHFRPTSAPASTKTLACWEPMWVWEKAAPMGRLQLSRSPQPRPLHGCNEAVPRRARGGRCSGSRARWRCSRHRGQLRPWARARQARLRRQLRRHWSVASENRWMRPARQSSSYDTILCGALTAGWPSLKVP